MAFSSLRFEGNRHCALAVENWVIKFSDGTIRTQFGLLQHHGF